MNLIDQSIDSIVEFMTKRHDSQAAAHLHPVLVTLEQMALSVI